MCQAHHQSRIFSCRMKYQYTAKHGGCCQTDSNCAHIGTKPAPGVIATRPVPITRCLTISVGFLFLITSTKYPREYCGLRLKTRLAAIKCVEPQDTGNTVHKTGIKAERQPQHKGAMTEYNCRDIVNSVIDVYNRDALPRSMQSTSAPNTETQMYNTSIAAGNVAGLTL